MSALTNSMGERVRVWRVVPTLVHCEADVDVSEIEPETGFTQRAARELAHDRNHAGVPDPCIRWVPEPTEREADRSKVIERLRETSSDQ
jgi:hypothetical protein